MSRPLFLFWISLLPACFVESVISQGCPYGWVDYSSSQSCYYLSDPTLGYNYPKASSKCESHEAYLVQIDVEEELKWLKQQVNKIHGRKFKTAIWWLGLRGKGSVIEYDNGNPAEAFVKPQMSKTNSSRKQCGQLTSNGTLVMTPDCFGTWISYICERPKNISLTCDVDNQWIYSNGACYRMFKQERAWEDARRYCIEHDADLAKITDREAQAMIWDLARNENNSKYWTGLRADGKQFLWTDNAVLEKPTFWNREEPKALGSKRTPMCVGVDSKVNRRLASWVSIPCTQHASFTCSKKPGVCSDGWIQHQTSCLMFDFTISLSWTDAKAYCRFIGGDLVMLKSASDQTFLASYIRRIKDGGVKTFWIGLSDEKSSFSWFWSDGTKLNSSMSKWAKNPPKNTPGERDCAFINTVNSRWRITNVCYKDKPFICEVPAGKVVKPPPTIPDTDQCEIGWGWESVDSFCLKFYNDTSTWYQAVSQCQSDNAELLIISSEYIQTFLEGNLVLGEMFWIGLSDREEEGTFVWVNGSKVTTSKWSKGEPLSDSSKNCVLMQSEGKSASWKVDSCQKNHKFICSKKAAKPRRRRMSAATTTEVPYDSSCGKEWELRSNTGFCYQFRNTKLSWLDALDVCAHHNGSLVSIVSRDEQSYIEGRLKGLSSVAVWIGANDRENEAGWAWDDGAPFGFFNWFPGEPNNMGNKEDCAAINTMTMAWYDYPCETRAGFVCKKQADGQATTAAPATTPISIPRGKFYGCPTGWLAYQNKCFLMRKTEVSWIDAQTACRKNGAELVSVGSLQENQMLFSYLPKVSCRNIHSNSTSCQAWADIGECEKNPQWMSINCKASCKFCTQTCSDKHTHNECRFWASIGECSKNKWMPENCALSCGCDNSINYGFWIGLNDRQSQMSFAWSDYSPLMFTHWAKNEPNNYDGKKEDCVKMFSASGEWSDEVCDENSSGYICKKDMDILDNPTVSPNQVGCPIGAFGYGPMCYMVLDIPLTWQEAKGYCNQRKANLATIPDSITGAFVTSELIGKTSSYWLGLRLVGTTYSWISGAKVSYTPWAQSHTGNKNNTCITVRSQRPIGLWEDLDCQKQQPFICEIFRAGYSTTTHSTPSSPTTPPPCPDGWKGFQKNCYKLHTEVKTWSEGQAFCQLYGGSLASIHDDATQNFLSGKLTYMFTPQAVWIGLSDKDRESSYKWADGSPFDYNNWGKNEPNNAYGAEDCVQLYRSGNYWNDNSCFTSSAFICSVLRGFPIPSVPPTVVTSPAPACTDSGWFYRKGFCYYISPSYGTEALMTWYQASRKCMAFGGRLASIASQAENDFLLSMISKQSNQQTNRFWIGLNELGSKSYHWSDGSPPIFLAWSMNEPNDAWGGQKCVNMYSDSGRWNDDNCMDQISYICKKQNGTSMPSFPVPTPILKTQCPPGFQGSGLTNKCYYLGGLGKTTNDTALNWTSARNKCRRLPSSSPVDIASISSLMDQDFITLLLRDVQKAVWIGLTDQQTHGTFKWQDNQEVSFTNWGQGEPNDHWSVAGERDCIQMIANQALNPTEVGKWKIEVCRQKNAYLCQTLKVSQGQTMSPSTMTTQRMGPGQCPSTYFTYNNTCFNVIVQPKTWQEARKSCQFFNGDLASVLDIFEIARLDLALYNSHVMQQAWIGLSFNSESSSYQWSDGWPLEYTFWSKNDPDIQTSNSCVAMYRGRWNDTDCTLQLPFICAIRKGEPPTPTPTSLGYCLDPKQTAFDDSCYLTRLNHKVSWPEAVYACGQLGMDLVSVHSSQESTFLYEFIKSQSSVKVKSWNWGSSSTVWLGLTRDGKDGFRWSDKSDVNFFNWAEGEPNSKVSALSSNYSILYDEACVEMDQESAQWHDVDCLGKNQGYICKVKKVLPSTTFTVPEIQTKSTMPSLRTEKQPFTGHSTLKESKSGMTTGQVAGVVLGVISFFIIVAVIIFIVHQRSHFANLKAWAFQQDTGFDNALYKHHVGKREDSSVEENTLDQMSPDNSITLGSTNA